MKTQTVFIKTSPKKKNRWQINLWKDGLHHMSSETCKLKPHWDTTKHLLERPKSGTLTTPNADKDVEQQELIHCWWECKVVQPPWKIVWWFLTKLNILLPYNSAINLPKGAENLMSTQTPTHRCLQQLYS